MTAALRRYTCSLEHDTLVHYNTLRLTLTNLYTSVCPTYSYNTLRLYSDLYTCVCPNKTRAAAKAPACAPSPVKLRVDVSVCMCACRFPALAPKCTTCKPKGLGFAEAGW